MLGGDGIIVEIDESKFGKRKYNRGHRVEGQWIVGGFERGTGRLFIAEVEDRTKETMEEVIKTWVKPGTTIHTDFWKAYDWLGDDGFEHMKVNHSLHFVDPKTGVHTNSIEGAWRHAKNFIPQYSRKKTKYPGY